MKGEHAPPTNKLQYPLFCSEKIDGIRALIAAKDWVKGNLNITAKHKEYLGRAKHAIALSSSGKPIPNYYIQSTLDQPSLIGCDGELTASNRFNETSSAIMSRDGDPAFNYEIFDAFNTTYCFRDRLKIISGLGFPILGDNVCITTLPQYLIENQVQLDARLDRLLSAGAEGAIVRAPLGLYKFGRSTVKQGWLLKIKNFLDSEATIIGAEELLHNLNEAEANELGYTKRSSHQANKSPSGKLGAFICITSDGVQFKIGTGYTDEERINYWMTRSTMLGKVVKYKHLLHGSKDAPRHPVFLGIRAKEDIT